MSQLNEKLRRKFNKPCIKYSLQLLLVAVILFLVLHNTAINELRCIVDNWNLRFPNSNFLRGVIQVNTLFDFAPICGVFLLFCSYLFLLYATTKTLLLVDNSDSQLVENFTHTTIINTTESNRSYQSVYIIQERLLC